MKEPSRTPAEQEVAEFIAISLEVVSHNDADVMETLLAEEYELVVSTGQKMSKQQLIEVYRRGNLKQEAWNVEYLHVRLYCGIAVARGLYHLGFQYKGGKIEQSFLRTDVLARAAGKWLFVRSHTVQSS